MNTYNRKLTKLKPRNMGCHTQSTNEVSIFWCHIPNFPMLKKDKNKQTKTPICFKVFSLPWRGALQIVIMDKSLNGFASFMFFFFFYQCRQHHLCQLLQGKSEWNAALNGPEGLTLATQFG